MENEKRMNNNNTDYGDGFYAEDIMSKRQRYVTASVQSDAPRNNKPPKKKGKAKKIIVVIMIIILLLILAAGVYIISVLSRVHYTREYPDHTNAEKNGITLRSENGIENILIFGEDNRKDSEYGRSDSMIMLTIDKNHKVLKQTSFLRDIYLYIPDHGYNKLNSAFSIGGAKLAAETIEYNFGIRIDDYITIDFNSFTDIIDSIGGIDIELTYDEIVYINWQSYKNKQVTVETEIDPDSFIYYINSNEENVALVHLNGRQALWYSRDRDSAGSDFDRTKRQRILIDTLFTKLKNSGPIALLKAVYSVSGYLTTDISPISLLGKGTDLIGALKYERKENRLPANDNYYDVYNDSGLALQIADEELEKQRLHEFVFG